jgi:hypothetical protein
MNNLTLNQQEFTMPPSLFTLQYPFLLFLKKQLLVSRISPLAAYLVFDPHTTAQLTCHPLKKI